MKIKLSLAIICLTLTSNLFANDCPYDLKDYFDIPEGCCYPIGGSVLVADLMHLSENLGKLSKQPSASPAQVAQIKTQIDSVNNFIKLLVVTGNDITPTTIMDSLRKGLKMNKPINTTEIQTLIDANESIINRYRFHFTSIEDLAKKGFNLKIAKLNNEIISAYFCHNKNEAENNINYVNALNQYNMENANRFNITVESGVNM